MSLCNLCIRGDLRLHGSKLMPIIRWIRYSENNDKQQARYDDDGHPDDWVEGWDDVRMKKYYYSKSRKKSVWKLPDGGKGASRPASRASSPVGGNSRGGAHSNSTSSWVPVFDPKSQRQYWYHRWVFIWLYLTLSGQWRQDFDCHLSFSITRQTSWTNPSET